MATDPSPQTIFVVDDDQGLSRLIQKVLRREGFSTAAASSGQEALAWLAHHRADLMLLDLKLRDSEGQELVNRLAELRQRIPFIVITGQGDERVAVEMMKRGALDYLVKDVDFLQFLPEVVRRAFDHLAKEERLAQAEEQARLLEKEVLEISDREQRRIGQDLHDGLGQQLTAIELMCESLKSQLAPFPPALVKQAAQMGQCLRQAIAETRSLARGLAPFKVEDGLEAALTALAQTTSSLGRVKCRVHCPSPVLLEDSETAAHLYRIAQEAVNNAVKHSHATQVTIQIMSKNGALDLKVSDNGRGIPKPKGPSRGLGLQVMKHRASVLGAEFKVESCPGKGVTVTCALRKHHS